MEYQLYKKQLVRRDLKTVFAFFEQPENLETITPPWLKFKILTPQPIVMREGTTIDYRVTAFLGIPMRWTSLIKEYQPLKKFVDVQVRGPYTLWHHEHLFETTSQGVWILDRVRYTLPLGILGRAIHSIHVKNQLEEIFDFRFKTIQQIFPD